MLANSVRRRNDYNADANRFFPFTFTEANASGTRSTALTDLRWFTAIFLTGLVGAYRAGAPTWILILLGVAVGASAILYLCVYVYFAVRNPDLLRSEKFNISKLAIEHSIKGDNLTGFIDMGERLPVVKTPALEKEDEK